MALTSDSVQPPSEPQIELAEWLSHYKHVPLFPEVYRSKVVWWRWLNSQIGRVECEDAREATIDFGIVVKFDDPVSVTGALKFRDKVINTPVDLRAANLLRKGHNPADVQEMLMLTDAQREKIAREVEAEGYEIDWGSS